MTTGTAAGARTGSAVSVRTLPFILFMTFIGVEELLRVVAGNGWLALPAEALYSLYPLKAAGAALLLVRYLPEYVELSPRKLWEQRRETVLAVVAGAATFVMWVGLDWRVDPTGTAAGFDPTIFPAGPLRAWMTVARVAGAVLVVPVMEELFWRSFLLRYLVSADFEAVPLGTFTWGSFVTAALLFGLEHHEIVAGMIAGAVYSVILYRTRSLAHSIVAHATTNLALACYVIGTGSWQYW